MKYSKTLQIHLRDALILILFLGLIATNLVMYKALDNHSKSYAELKIFTDDIVQCINNDFEECNPQIQTVD